MINIYTSFCHHLKIDSYINADISVDIDNQYKFYLQRPNMGTEWFRTER